MCRLKISSGAKSINIHVASQLKVRKEISGNRKTAISVFVTVFIHALFCAANFTICILPFHLLKITQVNEV